MVYDLGILNKQKETDLGVINKQPVQDIGTLSKEPAKDLGVIRRPEKIIYILITEDNCILITEDELYNLIV